MEVRDGVAHYHHHHDLNSSTIPSVLGIPQYIEKIRMGRMVFLKKKKKKKKRKHPTPFPSPEMYSSASIPQRMTSLRKGS